MENNYYVERGYLVYKTDKNFKNYYQNYNNDYMDEEFGYDRQTIQNCTDKEIGYAIKSAYKFINENKSLNKPAYVVIQYIGKSDQNSLILNEDLLKDFHLSIKLSIGYFHNKIYSHFIDPWNNIDNYKANKDCIYEKEVLSDYTDPEIVQDIKMWRFAAKNYFIYNNLSFKPEANLQVLKFIANFLYSHALNCSYVEAMRRQFMAGYCYYFAHILNLAFKQGTVCRCGTIGHFVCEIDGIYYDIQGVNTSKCECYIPESDLPEYLIRDYLHIEPRHYNSLEEQKLFFSKYYEDHNIKYTI
jgi:hypothetical protein